MKKVLLKISYDGTNYSGWQRQDNALTVQEVVETAIRKLSGQEVSLIAASRTDAGVHALSQFASFEDESTIPAEKYAIALNTKLPYDIRVLESKEVEVAFHCRFDVIHKTYQYRIHCSPHASALFRNFSYHVPYALDLQSMQMAAVKLIGEHDFTAFESTGGITKSKVRHVYESKLFLEKEFIIYHIKGNGFLYNMVRIIVGTLIDIGKGKLACAAIDEAFIRMDRRCLGHTAPPQGLVLTEVMYPKQ